MMLNIVLLLVGFVMLIKGADVFVDSSSGIAKKFNIPSIVIGMTIVAMGTSAPELSVSVNSALAGLNDMSIANVVGSNLFNILGALGVCSFISKLKINKFKDVWTLVGVCILFTILILDASLSVFDGCVLLVVFAFYIYKMIKQAKNEKEEVTVENSRPLSITIALGLIGLAAIVWGGDLVVTHASNIAYILGMSENLVGLTIVAIGTSLPEFVTSLIATKKGELNIAIGNVLGSNIFNILLILGCASVINPMVVTTFAYMDILMMTLSTILFAVLTFRSKSVGKVKGMLFIILYALYMLITIIR